MSKRKTKTIAQLVQQAAELLQKYVKIKAAGENGYVACVTCGEVKHWTDMQGGHFIGRQSIATKLMEENIHPQCVRCNKYLGGNLIEYTTYMYDMYGAEFVNELRQLKHITKKYTRSEVNEIIRDLKLKIKEII